MQIEQRQDILNEAIKALERTTGLKARMLPDDNRPGQQVEGLLEIQTPERVYPFVAEVRAVDRFETPALIKAHAPRLANAPILVAPYITREIAKRCKELTLPFIDTAGNAYIEAEGLFVLVVGNHRPVHLAEKKFRAFTPAGLQLTFALLCRPDLLNANYRAIAAEAKVALGTVGPVIKDLVDRRLIQSANGKLRFADPRRAMDEWVTRYPTTLRPKLNPRRFDAGSETFPTAQLTEHAAFWGGEVAADRLTRMLLPEFFIIYAGGPLAPLVGSYRLRARPNGNVEILNKFWNVTAKNIPSDIAPPQLIYADLMATQDGRNIEIANRIYDQFIEPAFGQTR